MSDFDELYAVFIRTAPAKEAIEEMKRQHPGISAGAAASAAKNMAEIAYNLGMDSYFDPEIKEGAVTRNWNSRFCEINRLEPQQLAEMVGYSEIFADRVMPNTETPKDEALCRAIFAMSAKAMVTYAPERLNDDSLHKFMAITAERITSPDNGLGLKDKFPLALQVFSSLYQDNPSAYFNRLGMVNKAIQKLDDPQTLVKVCEEIDMTYLNEGNLTPAMAEGFEKYVIPMINKTPDFNTLSAEHDCAFGEYGLIGYNNKILTSEWSPRRFNEALGILKEVPTPDMTKRELLRTKAIELEVAEFNGLRDMIHSETIGVSELVGHMLNYYQAAKSGDKPSADENAALIAGDLKNVQSEDFLPAYLDISRYETIVNQDTGETAAGLIQTIAENMQKSNNHAPRIGDKELDNLSRQLAMDNTNDTRQFGEFLSVLNNKLIDGIEAQKIGITPPMVDLLYWCDKKSANILKSRDFEQQCGDHKTDWFKQIALFAELTNSAETGFNRKGFEAYFSHVQAQDYFFDANNILIQRQRQNTFKLFDASKETEGRVTETLRRRLRQDGRNPDEIDYEAGKLGDIFDNRRRRMVSGNLVCEIFKLNDFKRPSTRIGERYAEEMKHKCQIERPVEKTLLKMLRAKGKDK